MEDSEGGSGIMESEFRPSFFRTFIWWPIALVVLGNLAYNDFQTLGNNHGSFTSLMIFWGTGCAIVFTYMDMTLMFSNGRAQFLLALVLGGVDHAWLWFYHKTPHYKKRLAWKILQGTHVEADKTKGWMSFS
jgi:hypothetical protein